MNYVQDNNVIVHECQFEQQDISKFVKHIIDMYPHVKIITIQGSLGAGKTTIAIEFLRQLGVVDQVQSPTYTYLQTYTNSLGKNFYHFDLYRLRNKNDFLFAGFDEFLYQDNALVLIEWPEIVQPLLEVDVCIIELMYKDENQRIAKWYYK